MRRGNCRASESPAKASSAVTRAQVTRARGISDSLCAYNAAGTAMADKTALLITDIYQSDGEQARCEQIGALLDEYLRAMLSEGLAADGDIQ